MSNETCPTCGSEDRAERFSVDERGEVRDPFLGNPGFTQPCDDEWHATPPAPAPADDASGAEAMREALRGWARFCAKWPAKECDDGSGYYSEADHDQAACYADTLRVLALPRPARGDGDWWARHVLEATDLAALKSIAEGWPMSRPAPRDAARDAIAAERDRCAALLRQMAIARGDLDERLVLQHAARCVEKCPACEGCGMDADGAPCKSCAETTA